MKFFTSVNKANAELTAAEAAMQPDLEKAGIATAMSGGKTIPVAEATVAEKYLALRAAQPAGTDLQQRSELLQSNDIISKRCEKTESDLAISQTSVDTLTRENAALRENFTAAQGTIQTMTVEKADSDNRLLAAVNQFTANANELKVLNETISKACLAVQCLDLTKADGTPLEYSASVEEKLEAANRIPANDKIKAYANGLNNAIAATGLDLARLPGAALKFAQASPKGIMSEYNTITDSAAKTEFYRKHKDAIDQSFREKSK